MGTAPAPFVEFLRGPSQLHMNPLGSFCSLLASLGTFWGGQVSGATLHSDLLFPHQAQLIHDRNTASHTVATARTEAPPTPDKVQMTWTKEKLIAEKHRNKDTGTSGFKDLFSLKP